MSFKSWFFPDQKRPKAATPAAETAGGHRKGAPKQAASPGDDASARRKDERAARRELIYAVVRDAMVREGVLSASYKFKVLSLDGEGRQYLIMMDLGREASTQAHNLPEIEALIARSAKSRHELVVTAVYWRLSEHVAQGRATARQPTRFGDSQPAADSQPAPLHSAPAPLTAPPARGPAYDPIDADEVAAFKKALVTGSTRPMPRTATAQPKARASNASASHGPRSFTLLTGYEDTELPEGDHKAPQLSGTQYGELR